MRKVVFSILIILFLYIAGCSNPVDKKKNLREFSFYYGNPKYSKLDLFNTSVGIMIQSKTGIRLNMEYTKSDDLATEAAYMISSEIYPDIIYGHTATKDFVSAGALIPLNDLIEKYGQNIKKHYGKNLALFADEKGIIYYIGPNYQLSGVYYPNSGFKLPLKLLKEAGWPVVRRFDHYIELIKDYVSRHKNKRPSLVGFSALFQNTSRNTLLAGAAHLMGYPSRGDVYIPDMDNPKAHLIIQSEFAKKYFKVLNELWNEGFLDKEIFTLSEGEYYNKIARGDLIGFFDYENTLYEVITAQERRGHTEDSHIPFPVLFEGVTEDAYNILKINADRGVGISVSCKEPEEVVKFWNRILEEDIQRFIYWGIEKLHYYKTKEGKFKKSPTHLRTLYRPEDGIMRFIDGFPGWDQTGFFSDGTLIDQEQEPAYIDAVAPGYLKNVIKQYKVDKLQELFSPPRKFPFGSGDSIVIPAGHRIEKVKKALTHLTDKYVMQVITVQSKEFDFTWQEFQKALQKVDIKSYLDYHTSYYRRIKKLLE